MREKGVAVAAEDEGNFQRFGIIERLLHAGTDAVRVVLGLDDGNRQVGPAVENVVGALLLAACVQLAAYDDSALGKAGFLAHLRGEAPASPLQRRRDELRADVAFGELIFSGTLDPVSGGRAFHITRASRGGEVRIDSTD